MSSSTQSNEADRPATHDELLQCIQGSLNREAECQKALWRALECLDQELRFQRKLNEALQDAPENFPCSRAVN